MRPGWPQPHAAAYDHHSSDWSPHLIFLSVHRVRGVTQAYLEITFSPGSPFSLMTALLIKTKPGSRLDRPRGLVFHHVLHRLSPGTPRSYSVLFIRPAAAERVTIPRARGGAWKATRWRDRPYVFLRLGRNVVDPMTRSARLRPGNVYDIWRHHLLTKLDGLRSGRCQANCHEGWPRLVNGAGSLAATPHRSFQPRDLGDHMNSRNMG